MQEIYAYEEQEKLKFEQEFDALCAHISKKYGWTYTIQLYICLKTKNLTQN